MESIVQKRRVIITDENLGPIVSIASILLLIHVVLTVFARLCIRYFARKELSLEDRIIFTAAIFSIGELVTVLGLDSNGLGSPIEILTDPQVFRFQKYFYSTDVLYVVNLGLTKISILLFIRSLTPIKKQKIAILAGIGFTVLWTIASLLVLLFQCHVPSVWQFISNKCMDRTSFWISYTVINVATEFALILLSVALVWGLKTSRSNKALVVIPFMLRILVIIPAIAQLAYFVPTTNSDDPTLDLWKSVICAQFTQSISIMTACFIQLKQFVTSLHSGLLHNDDLSRRQRQNSRGGASGYLSLNGSGRNPRSKRSG